MELPNRLGSAEQRVGSSASFRNRLPTWLGGERSGNLSSGEVPSAPEVTSSGNPETPQVRRERRRAMFSRARRQDTGETDSSEPLSRSTSAIRLASSSSALVTSAEQRVGSSSSFRNRLPTWFGGERPGNLSSGEVPSAPEVTSSGNPETPQARRERRRAMFSRAKRQDTGGTDSSELQSSPTSAIRLASSSSALVTSAERRVGSSSSVERKVGSDSQIYKQPHEYAQIKDVAQRIYRKATPILGILDSSEHPVASSLGEDERTEIKDLIKWAHEGLKKRSGDSKEGYSKENKKLKKDYDQIDKRLDQWVEYLKKGEKLPPIDSNFISLYSRGILDFSTPNRGFYDKFTDKMKKNLKYEGSDDLKYEVSDERKLWRARLEIDSMKPEQLEEVLKACAKELNNSFQFSGYYFQDGDTLVYQFNNSIPPDKPRSSEDCKEAFELLSNEMNSLQVKFRSSSIDGPGQLPGDSSDYSVLVPFGKTIGFVEGNKEAEEINTIDIEDSTRANEDDESGRIMRASILSVSWSASTDKPEVYTERVGLIREKNIGAISKICAAGLSYGQELLVFEFHRRGTTVAVATKRENWQK